LRRIFGPKREEVAGGWRRLYDDDLQNLYTFPHTVRVIKSRRMRWAGHVASMGEMRSAYKLLVGKPEGKRPHGKQRNIWEDKITMYLREIGWKNVDWIHLTQDRGMWWTLVNTVMYLWVS
jgi:hypothetical protein